MSRASQPLHGREKLVVIGLQIAMAIAVLVLWHYASLNKAVSSIMLPRMSDVASEFVRVLRGGAFWADLGITIDEIVWSFIIAGVLGVAAGFAVSRRNFDVRVFEPLMSGLYAVPTIIIYPLYVLFFGLGPESKIALGASVAFFPIALHTMSGFAAVSPRLIDASKAMGASRWRLFKHVLFPAAFPVVIAGMRVGFILAFLSVIGGEMLASYRGIGRLIIDQAEAMNTATMYAYIVFLVMLSLVLNAIVFGAERWLASRWRY
jgi:ABC-type nitrate/sulfonate/bicarbonate transport system permease component